ncbi:Peptidase M10 [Macleaya cordata]|uniref:Peptidase M10 n=1 Tax=Macleaya cordata TaxID=56857 RepID=A0A200QV54_MACCD|nr:Peptidase M10 [Macleaya cordata]
MDSALVSQLLISQLKCYLFTSFREMGNSEPTISNYPHAFPPTIGMFHYDAEEHWSTKPGPGMMDLESVAVHEIGHLLGLGSSSEPNAILFPSITSGVKKRELHGDGVQDIHHLYDLNITVKEVIIY